MVPVTEETRSMMIETAVTNHNMSFIRVACKRATREIMKDILVNVCVRNTLKSSIN